MIRLTMLPTPGFSTSSATRSHAYAFSFDRETFRGSFPTRAAAVDAAEAALERYAGPVEAIWVGRTVEAKPPVGDFAELVIEHLAERQREEGQEPLKPGEFAVEELDRRLASLLENWMKDHDLLPLTGVEAVSEHPIRLVQHVDESGRAGREVSLIGDVG